MKVAIVGCCHGSLTSLYSSIKKTEDTYNVKVDLVIICGDFQSIRNETDLKCINCPDKYKSIGDFHKYYSGELTVPYMTIFIGGNHEASNYLYELYHGGWVCPNIYFLGHAGVINYRGLRIAGLSGIYKDNHFEIGQYEKMPYDNNSIRSIYHVRKFDWQRLLQIEKPIDIMITHDWPTAIPFYGNYNKLLQQKSFFRNDMYRFNLGSTPNNDLLMRLKPSYWFSAHLHCKFSALINYDNIHHEFPTYFEENKPETTNSQTAMYNTNKRICVDPRVAFSNPDEIVMNDEDDESDNDHDDHDNENNTSERNKNEVSKINNENEIVMSDVDEDEEDEESKEDEENTTTTENINNNNDDMDTKKDEKETSTTSENDMKRKYSLSGENVNNKNEDPMEEVTNQSIKEVKKINKVTKFLALDKCLPRRQFLQIIDIPTDHDNNSHTESIENIEKKGENETRDKDENNSNVEGKSEDTKNEVENKKCEKGQFMYDEEWFAITKAYSKYFTTNQSKIDLPSLEQMKAQVEKEMEWVKNCLSNKIENKKINLNIYENPFVATAPSYPMNSSIDTPFVNPQTEKFCDMIDIPCQINK